MCYTALPLLPLLQHLSGDLNWTLHYGPTTLRYVSATPHPELRIRQTLNGPLPIWRVPFVHHLMPSYHSYPSQACRPTLPSPGPTGVPAATSNQAPAGVYNSKYHACAAYHKPACVPRTVHVDVGVFGISGKVGGMGSVFAVGQGLRPY